MMAWLNRLSLLALMLSVFLGIGYSQRHTINTLRLQRDQAKQHETEKNALIEALQRQEREHEVAQLALQTALSRIRQTHAQREMMTRSTYEIPTVRAWANTPLPESLIRLREHGTLIGPCAYTPYLRSSTVMPAPSESPQN